MADGIIEEDIYLYLVYILYILYLISYILFISFVKPAISQIHNQNQKSLVMDYKGEDPHNIHIIHTSSINWKF